MMTEEELKQIQARANAATPGPWRCDSTSSECDVCVVREWSSGDVVAGGIFTRDAIFITEARKDVPALVAEVRRLRTLLLTSETRASNNRCEIERLRADVERIGAERDQMVAANVELQEQLSRLEDDRK